jgi:sugar/nucleoside kinase (ribokinase family)/nucleoside 2-deoxyribosyltransferase
MSICVYGEIGFDWFVQSVHSIYCRWGGAALYASLAAAKQGAKVNLLTVLGEEVDPYVLTGWEMLGVSFQLTKREPTYSLPKYIVTGFGKFEHKVSRPLTEVKLQIDYSPNIPDDCSAIIIFPFNHSLPKTLIKTASERRIPVFLDPKPNENSIEDAKKLLNLVDVLLVNEDEIKKLSGKSNIEEAIQDIRGKGLKRIILKCGIRGCIVIDDSYIKTIPSYKSNSICTLGSGDVFAGAFVATFIDTKDLLYSTDLASCVVSHFIEHTTTECVLNKEATQYEMTKRTKIDIPDIREKGVYLAGPFFCIQERMWVEKVCNTLENAGLRVLSPSRENGIIDENWTQQEKQQIFLSDIKLIEQANVVVALLDHDDSGTYFEIGYAYKKGIPIIGLRTSNTQLNNMILFGCHKITKTIEELIEEIYEYFR